MTRFWHEMVNVLCVVIIFSSANETVRGVIACLAIAGIVFIHNWKQSAS